jgi:arylsulfate sulfotransferase
MRSFAIVALTLFLFASCKKDNTVAIDNGPTEGQVVLSTYSAALSSPGKLSILDKNGTTLWEKTTPTAPVNFRKWTVNNKVRYTYMEFDVSTPQITPGILPTTGVVLDENFNEIKRVRLLPNNGRTASDPTAIDAHDFIYLDDNHFITLSYFQKAVNNIPASLNPVANCVVVEPIIQEVLNDQVVWEWDGADYPELYTTSVEGNAFSNGSVAHDYVHMNSLYVDSTDNTLICSMRNLNQIIKINRTNGSIVWRLGGTNSDFPITPDMKFLRQHHATLTDNNQTLLLLDNGEATERAYSRVLEFKLNQEDKTISSFKPYTLPDNIFAQYMGSVQKRGDTYFISCGSTPKILEVNYVTNNVNFLMNLPNVSYRALKN